MPSKTCATSRTTIGTNPLDAVVPDLRALQDGAPAAAPNAEPAPNPMRKERLTIHLSAGLIERLKNAVFWTPGLTLADVGEQALTRFVDELEAEHGAPFETRSSELKGGRPLKRS